MAAAMYSPEKEQNPDEAKKAADDEHEDMSDDSDDSDDDYDKANDDGTVAKKKLRKSASIQNWQKDPATSSEKDMQTQ